MDEEKTETAPASFADLAEDNPKIPLPGFTTLYSLALLIGLVVINIFFL